MLLNKSQFKTLARLGGVCAVTIALSVMVFSDAFARGGRGGGGRGGGGMSRGGGGGMSRGGGGYSRGGSYGGASRSQSYNRSPSMSRPSTPQYGQAASRPSTANRGGASINRGAASAGNRSAASVGNRGGASTANRGGATNRAGATGRAAQGANPSRSDLSSFLNMPSQGGGRAAAGAAGGNAAINDFFSHNPASGNHNAAATHNNVASNRQAGSIANQRSENISNRTDARADVRGSRGENRNYASDNRQDRVSDRGDRQAARVSNRGETRSTLASNRGENRSERQQRRSEHADGIRDALENEFDNNHLFDDFWKNNPQAYYRFNQNPVFWTWATAATVGSFFGGGYVYSDGGGGGGGGDYYYDDGMVYGGEEPIPAEEYAAEAEEIVEAAPEVENPDDMEWLPLGVFALAESKNADAVPNMFLQLAVSKEGIVAGNYNNKSTDEVKSVEGMVDMESGRAAWTIAGKSSPIMETKIENLTENETSALVHFADGTTQEWLMLHLEKPADEQ